MTTQEPIVVIDDSLAIRRLEEAILTRAERADEACPPAGVAMAAPGGAR